MLLIERNQPRGQLITGRVKKTYPGTDNLVRVVDVESKDGIYRRAIHTLCLLGSPDEEENSLTVGSSVRVCSDGTKNRTISELRRKISSEK